MALSSYTQRLRSLSNKVAWTPGATSQSEKEQHILGLRGVLAISSFLWIFFKTFIPAVESTATHGPLYQKIIRVVFSTVFWNETLISSFFFVLSARAICVRFLKDPTADNFAGSIIRRTLRIVIVTSVASWVAYGIFGALGTEYFGTFIDVLPNKSISPPGVPESAIQGFNAVFDMYWVVTEYSHQAANLFWPTNTLGRVSLLYNQSWTVYFLMVLLPFGRAAWHVQLIAFFTFGAFWMCSWGWYSACGLLLADVTINTTLSAKLNSGLKISEKQDWTVPYSVVGLLMLPIGLGMKYCWAVFPQYIDKELVLHPYLDLSEQTTPAQFAYADPYPRLDDFFVIFGLLLIVESLPRVRSILSAKWLVALGSRSLSLYIAQCLVVWTAGIKLFLHLHDKQVSDSLANLAVFFTTAAAVLLLGEVYYQAVDLPSQWAARQGYRWLTT